MTRPIMREITKEQFDKGTKERTIATGIFSDREVMGYGVYDINFVEQNGKYFVRFQLGSGCD